MKVTTRTVTEVLLMCWGVAFGRWFFVGPHVDTLRFVPLLAVLNIPLVAFVYYRGHRHGYDERQAEVRASVEATRRRLRDLP